MRRLSQQKHFPPSRRLLYCVLKGLPRLDVTLHGLPAEAAAGELLRAQVRGQGRPAAAVAGSACNRSDGAAEQAAEAPATTSMCLTRHACVHCCCCWQVVVRNSGLLPARNLKVAVSHPAVALADTASVQPLPAGADATLGAAGACASVWQALTGAAGGGGCACSCLLRMPAGGFRVCC